MTFDRAGKPTPLRSADDVNDVAVCELIYQNLIAHVGGVVRSFESKLFQHPRWRNPAAGLLEVTTHRLVDVLQPDRALFDQSNLHRIVTVTAAGSLLLHYNTRAGLDHCD